MGLLKKFLKQRRKKAVGNFRRAATTDAAAIHPNQQISPGVKNALGTTRRHGCSRHAQAWGITRHIPGATHIFINEIPARINELPKDKDVVFQCWHGNTSLQATAFLIENGWPASRYARSSSSNIFVPSSRPCRSNQRSGGAGGLT
jgi:rhodanese-related sulfurtransferase